MRNRILIAVTTISPTPILLVIDFIGHTFFGTHIIGAF